jgi:hypothetical protein
MEVISDYFASNPAAFTLLAIAIIVVILYSILKKLIKFAVVVVFIVLLLGGIYLFKDPASMPGKIKNSVETLKAGGEQIKDKFANLWADTKDLAGKAKKVPGDINKLLDTSKEQAGK